MLCPPILGISGPFEIPDQPETQQNRVVPEPGCLARKIQLPEEFLLIFRGQDPQFFQTNKIFSLIFLLFINLSISVGGFY